MDMGNSSQIANVTDLPDSATITLVAYSICGTTTIMVNILIFVIIFSDQTLREKSAIVIGVAGSNIMWGVSIAASGLYQLVNESILGRTVSAWFCVQLVFPLLMPLACQTLSVMLCMVGIDRLLATATPSWYFKNWTPQKSWLAVLVGYVIGILPLKWGLAMAWKSSSPVNLSCALPRVFGSDFVAWFFGFTVFGGTVAVVLTLTAYYCSMKRISKLSLLNGELGRLKKQLQLTRAMFTISSMDFILVVIPTAVACYANATKADVHPEIIQRFCNIVYCINATAIIVPHLVLNSKFRETAVKLFRRAECTQNNVAPDNAAPANRGGTRSNMAAGS